MRITIEYDNEADLLRVSAKGIFDLSVYKEAMDEIVNSVSYSPTVSTIWNLNELDFTKLENHIETKLCYARKHYPQRKGAKIAYVVNSQLGYGMMRMLEYLIGYDEADQKVFYDYVEAENWLRKSA